MAELKLNIVEGCGDCCECCSINNIKWVLWWIVKIIGFLIFVIHLGLIGLVTVEGIVIAATTSNIEWMPISLFVLWIVGNIIYQIIFWSNLSAYKLSYNTNTVKHFKGHDLICEKYSIMEKTPYVIYVINLVISEVTCIWSFAYYFKNYKDPNTAEMLKPLTNEFYFLVAYYAYLFLMIGIYYLITLSVQTHKDKQKGNITTINA